MTVEIGVERDVLFHFPRLWAARNDDREHVFANGHVYGRPQRRESVRSLIRMLRRIRA